MKRIILDLNPFKTEDKALEYIWLEMDIDGGFEQSLTGLYDALTERNENICVGIFCPPGDETGAYEYGWKVKRVFRDAQAENEHLGVIFGELEDNYGE
ncbi:hypothetical protein GPL15_19645 [Clostridium sp. MCC353]|uniref:hypothetical protein n=1 Tax=Clostridium sp. MCC353 TaxID=2592646 RepID=UPI001C02D477|nr:hypothetical protein [Clostridium sp. MCC353]MBT9778703.1 hypothetical protein [Clostridium sp. MCC353]